MCLSWGGAIWNQLRGCQYFAVLEDSFMVYVCRMFVQWVYVVIDRVTLATSSKVACASVFATTVLHFSSVSLT